MGDHIRSDDADRLFEGRGTPTDPDLAPLGIFARDLRAAFISAPDPDVRAAHLAAMAAVQPVGATGRPTIGRRRKPLVLKSLFAGAAAVIAAGAAMAATGSLPTPAQDLVTAAVSIDVGGEPQASPDVTDSPDPTDSARALGDPDTTVQPRSEEAAENKAQADAFTEAKRVWTECVREKAPEHRGPGGFDPEAACGEKPHPHDFRPDKTARPEHTPKAAAERTPKPSRTPGPGGGPPEDRGNAGDPPSRGPKQ